VDGAAAEQVDNADYPQGALSTGACRLILSRHPSGVTRML
jgi:hypothetical protein